MKQKMINLAKHNRFIYFMYRVFYGAFIRFIGLFIRVRDNRIIFASYGGKKYDDSPKVIFEYLKNNPKYQKYELIFALRDINTEIPYDCIKVKIDTLKYYKLLMSSKYWITNTSMSRGLKLKRKKNIHINTWHGTPLKLMAKDLKVKDLNDIYIDKIDLLLSQSEYNTDIMVRNYPVTKENVLEIDLPRNDILCNYTEDYKNNIKNNLNMPLNKKVILYMPTYRDYKKDDNLNYYTEIELDYNYLMESIGSEFILLVRAHHLANKINTELNKENIIDVSTYPYVNDLYIISDMIISDYSSSMIDYGILKRPIFNFSYDYEEYKEKRGLYVSLEDVLPCKICKTTKELVEEIKNFNYNDSVEKISEFKNKFTPHAGNSTESLIKYLEEKYNF